MELPARDGPCKIAPAFAAECTAVLEPAELTPLTTLFFAELLHDSGLPTGVVNVVATTASGLVSETIMPDTRPRKPSLVGMQLLSLDPSVVVGNGELPPLDRTLELIGVSMMLSSRLGGE